MNENLIITPKTKVLQLIEAYPQLEEVLIGYVPAFKKLKNPVLRNTVARITTLQQASAIGDVKVEELINHLRKKVGQDTFVASEAGGYNASKPEWFNEADIADEFNVQDMLDLGEHPVNQVMSDLKKLPEGKIYKLIAPFLPAPLIDKASGIGFSHWIQKQSNDSFVIYFRKL